MPVVLLPSFDGQLVGQQCNLHLKPLVKVNFSFPANPDTHLPLPAFALQVDPLEVKVPDRPRHRANPNSEILWIYIMSSMGLSPLAFYLFSFFAIILHFAVQSVSRLLSCNRLCFPTCPAASALVICRYPVLLSEFSCCLAWNKYFPLSLQL